MDIYVSRFGLLAAIANCSENLTVTLNNDKMTIINFTYKDVNIQRAKEFP